MKPARVTLGDGVQALLVPGVGLMVPSRDEKGHVLIGHVNLIMAGYPPLPLRETFDSLEEKFGETKKVLL